MYWNKFFRCAAEILENTGVIEKNQVFTGVSFSCPPSLVKKETKTKVIQRQVVEEKLLLDSIFVLQALKKSGMAFRNI